MTEPDEALLWARWAMRGYSRPSDVAIPLTAPLRIDGRRLSGVEAHNLTEALAEAYRAGAAASAERIKELEEGLSMLYDLFTYVKPSAFRNGVTDPTNTIDEGEVKAWLILDRAKALLKETDQ